MESILYFIIGMNIFFVLIGIPIIIWLIYDNKRREKEEELESAAAE